MLVYLHSCLLDCILFLTSVLLFINAADFEAVWAVNCGGPEHVDSHGVNYAADPLTDGIASDYGRSFRIGRVPVEDQIIYQTERYNTDSFSYTVPYSDDGDYVLILKFSEVWFSDPNQKVFHVQLNNEIRIVDYLDIFAEVGFATALERLIPIRIMNGLLSFKGDVTKLTGNYFTVDFIKTELDNPKVNAIVLAKGKTEDIPQLPPLDIPPVEPPKRVSPPDPEPTEPEQQRRPPGAPRAPDPYASTDYSNYLLPVIVSVAAFLPLLVCLCKV